MQIINMKLSEIHPYEKNPRFNDGAVEAVANSIKEFGFQQPIVVDKDFVVVVGHTRLKAAEQLGLTEVPVVIAENLTPEQVQAYRIADNKTGEIAEWNYDLLPIELRDLQEKDFDLLFGECAHFASRYPNATVTLIAPPPHFILTDNIRQLLLKPYAENNLLELQAEAQSIPCDIWH